MASPKSNRDGPPTLMALHHISVPCRDLDEGIRFYRDVLGGMVKVTEPAFALLRVGGTDIGISTDGCSWVSAGAEYPHFAFQVDAEALVAMKAWLARCGVPSSNFWTRNGVETLMFFRDPSGNLIELFCKEGYPGARDLPRGPARGHGTAIDVNATSYDTWRMPE
jgi:catechol 2,3-dioxygenase-like lactoylglutathione lyase family enzyme